MGIHWEEWTFLLACANKSTFCPMVIEVIAVKTTRDNTLKFYSRHYKWKKQMKGASHQRPHIVWFHLYEMESRMSRAIETERLVVARGWEEGGMGSDC